MDYFKLPISTKVQRVIPKNAFDNYTNTKQKKLFTDKINRITWTHKISEDTINLPSKDIQEIQIFKIELKVKEDIQPILNTIDKSIPYPIIFIVSFEEDIFISSSTKHLHPINEDNAVIDWTFKTDWFKSDENKYVINLKNNLDAVYKDFFVQLSGKPELKKKSLNTIINFQKEVDTLEKGIVRLKSAISKEMQFNRKVELNEELNYKKNELEMLLKRDIN